MSVRAVWNGVVLAEAADTVVVEGKHYFPAEAVHWQYLTASGARSLCPWKGIAFYYTVTVEGDTNLDAAWCYPWTLPWARRIKDRIAFWSGVQIEQAEPSPA